MRYIRYFCVLAFAVALATVALANREVVTVKLLPPEVANFFAVTPTIELRFFVVIFGCILAGLLLGFVWEYVREFKHRGAVTKGNREIQRLEREVQKLKAEKHAGKDDVLALLEETA